MRNGEVLPRGENLVIQWTISTLDDHRIVKGESKAFWEMFRGEAAQNYWWT